MAVHKGGYSPLCEGLGEIPSEPIFLPKANRPLASVVYPAEAMHINFITSLLKSQGYNAIMVFFLIGKSIVKLPYLQENHDIFSPRSLVLFLSFLMLNYLEASFNIVYLSYHTIRVFQTLSFSFYPLQSSQLLNFWFFLVATKLW